MAEFDVKVLVTIQEFLDKAKRVREEHGFLVNHMDHMIRALEAFRAPFQKAVEIGPSANAIGSCVHEMIKVLNKLLEYLDLNKTDWEYDLGDTLELEVLLFWTHSITMVTEIRSIMMRFCVAANLVSQDHDKERGKVHGKVVIAMKKLIANMTLDVNSKECREDYRHLLELVLEALMKVSEEDNDLHVELEQRIKQVLEEDNHNKSGKKSQGNRVLANISGPAAKYSLYLIDKLEHAKSILRPEEVTIGTSKQDIIGSGTYGVVYRGVYIGNKVVGKVLQGRLKDNIDKRLELLAEANEYSTMRHPNVVSFFGSVVIEGTTYIVLEFCEKSLDSMLHSDTFCEILEPDRVWKYSQGLFSGLTYLHQQGIIHRDIKPANILVKNDVPKLGDFGLVVHTTDAETYRVQGTYRYLPPECIRTPAYWTPTADVYAMGVVLFEILTNQKPFQQFVNDFDFYAAAKDSVNFFWEMHERQDMEDPLIVKHQSIANACIDPKGRPKSAEISSLLETRFMEDDQAFEEELARINELASSRHLGKI